MWIPRYPMHGITSSPYHESHTSLLPSGDLLFVSCLIVFGRTSKPMLNRRDVSGHPDLFQILVGALPVCHH